MYGCKPGPKGKKCVKYAGEDTGGCMVNPLTNKCIQAKALSKSYVPKRPATETQLANLAKARAAKPRAAPKPKAAGPKRAPTAWMQHVADVRAQNPGMADAMSVASQSYAAAPKAAPRPRPAPKMSAPTSVCQTLSAQDCVKHPRCNWLPATTKTMKKSGKKVEVAARCARSTATAMKPGVLRAQQQQVGGYWW